MRFSTLADWLHWQEQLHPDEIELGLGRINQVFRQLHPEPPSFNVITVAGTNGKGSSVALLEAILLAAGYRVAAYTSPHLLRYNERVRLQGQAVNDALLCEAFARIDHARGDISLTYFEFGTLAALDIFYRQGIDVAILEVGMGGRLDAVNIIDADVALITAIDVDHEKWLGNDREIIGLEKAGIMRPHRPVISSDLATPLSVVRHANDLGAQLFCLGKDFSIVPEVSGWAFKDKESISRNALPLPALRGEHQLHNAAGVLKVLQCIDTSLPVSAQALREGLLSVSLAGRFQVIPAEVMTILDVAHNPQSAAVLAQMLKIQQCGGRTLAVVGMLADKPVNDTLAALIPCIEAWFLGSLSKIPRGAEAEKLRVALSGASASVMTYSDVAKAYHAARQQAMPGDRIVVFGSFYTVAEVMLQTV